MSSRPLILIPPSEGKSAGGDGGPLSLDSLSFTDLNPTRARMLKALTDLSARPRSSKRVLGVKGPALEKAMAENASVETAPTMPTIERYTGVMYDAIEYRSLNDEARAAFNRDVVIMSGLFGMVQPLDPIPAYKLKMGATVLRRKSCGAIWKALNSRALAAVGEHGVIWDLLPLEHSTAWDPATVPHESRIKVKFVERGKDGQFKTITHLSKLLKGALIRHIVGNPGASKTAAPALEAMAEFSHPEGYVFSPEATTESDGATEIVFIKDAN